MDNQKQIALSKHLEIDVKQIEQSEYDDCIFVVNPHKKTIGHSPQYYKDTVKEFKELLTYPTRNKIHKYLKRVSDPAIKSDKELEKLLHNGNVLYAITEYEVKGKAAIKDWSYNSNIAHLLLKGYSYSKDTSTDLVNAWFNREVEDRRKQVDAYEDEYLVLTDDEAEERYEEYLENYINECIINKMPDQYTGYFDREAWKKDARENGRGNALNFYNGTECEQNVDGEMYYIYRQN